MSRHALRVSAAVLIAGTALLAGAAPAAAEPAAGSHDLAVTGSRISGNVGDDAVATVTVEADGATTYAIGTTMAFGGGVTPDDDQCTSVEAGVCWRNVRAEADTYTWRIRYRIRKAGTWIAPVYVRPVGYRDRNPVNNHTTVVISTSDTGGESSVTGGRASARVGDTATTQVTVQRPDAGPHVLVLTFDDSRVQYAGRCHERTRRGRQVECTVPGDHAGPLPLRFKVLAEGPTTVAVRLLPTDLRPDDNVATVVVEGITAGKDAEKDRGAAPEPTGSPRASASPGDTQHGGAAGDGRDLPQSGSPVAVVAASGFGVLAAGFLLYAAVRHRTDRRSA